MKGITFIRSFFTHRIGQPDTIVDYLKQNNIVQDFFYAWFGSNLMILAVDPESAKFVLKAPDLRKVGIPSFSSYSNDRFDENIIAVDGEDWRRQRTIVAPGFGADALSGYYQIFQKITAKGIKTLPENTDFEISDFFCRFTLDTLGKAIFDHDFGRIDGKNDKYYTAYKKKHNKWIHFVQRNVIGGISIC